MIPYVARTLVRVCKLQVPHTVMHPRQGALTVNRRVKRKLDQCYWQIRQTSSFNNFIHGVSS